MERVMEPAWKRYLTDYNEGLGVVYERFMLNDYLDRVLNKYPVRSVLEVPIYGMAGVSGINSVRLAQRGCQVTLVDYDAERLVGVKRIWGELGLTCETAHLPDLSRLPFPDGAFDLVWNFAALWYLPQAEATLSEIARVAARLTFIAMPNRWQVGYLLRKYALDRGFFCTIDEQWVKLGRIKRILEQSGLCIVEEGVLDVPPWPDTVMPAGEFLRKIGIRSGKMQSAFSAQSWHWSTMDYYLSKDTTLKARVERYALLDRLPLPWWLKLLWAHHHYVLGLKN